MQEKIHVNVNIASTEMTSLTLITADLVYFNYTNGFHHGVPSLLGYAQDPPRESCVG